MGARKAKYVLLIPLLILVFEARGWAAFGVCVAFVLGVAFGLLWERYSSSFSVLAGQQERRKRR